MKLQTLTSTPYEITPGEMISISVAGPITEDDRKDSEAISNTDSTICVNFGHSDWMHAGKVFTGECIRHLKPRVTPAGYVKVRFQNRDWYAIPTMITFISAEGKSYTYASWKVSYIEDNKEANARPSKARIFRNSL